MADQRPALRLRVSAVCPPDTKPTSRPGRSARRRSGEGAAGLSPTRSLRARGAVNPACLHLGWGVDSGAALPAWWKAWATRRLVRRISTGSILPAMAAGARESTSAHRDQPRRIPIMHIPHALRHGALTGVATELAPLSTIAPSGCPGRSAARNLPPSGSSTLCTDGVVGVVRSNIADDVLLPPCITPQPPSPPHPRRSPCSSRRMLLTLGGICG